MGGHSAAERTRALWNLCLFGALAYAALAINSKSILLFIGILQPLSIFTYLVLRLATDPAFTLHDALSAYDALFTPAESALILVFSAGYVLALALFGATLGVPVGVRLVSSGLFLMQFGVTLAFYGTATQPVR